MNDAGNTQQLQRDVEAIKEKLSLLTKLTWLALGLAVGSLLSQYFFGG